MALLFYIFLAAVHADGIRRLLPQVLDPAGAAQHEPAGQGRRRVIEAHVAS